jgi:hypothetical protein
VAVPLAMAQHRLITFLHAGDLAGAAMAAYSEGATVLTRAGVGGLAKTIAVQSIPAYPRGSVTVVPIRWMATGLLSGAFPVLDANLEMTATDGQTKLELVPHQATFARLMVSALAMTSRSRGWVAACRFRQAM